jgi:hypothetical protein
MIALRCTQKLAKRLKQPLEAVDSVQSDARLSEWTCHLVQFGRTQLIFCVNHQTLLTVLLPAAPAKTFPLRLRVALGKLLHGLGIDDEAVSAELQSFASYAFAKTNNRSVLGSLNDFARMAPHWIESNDPAHLLSISLKMATVPCTPLSEIFPDKAVRTLFTSSQITSPDV